MPENDDPADAPPACRSRTDLVELVRDLLPADSVAGSSTGRAHSMDTLLPQVYDELRGLAASYLRRERPNHTLQPTALVHEVYLRLTGDRPVAWQDRAHFLGVAARVMRRVLADSAAVRSAQKRGGNQIRVTLDEVLDLSDECTLSLSGVDEALRALERVDPRQGQVVELRFYGGLTTEEIAEVLHVSVATVKREWATAKLWLRHVLECQTP